MLFRLIIVAALLLSGAGAQETTAASSDVARTAASTSAVARSTVAAAPADVVTHVEHPVVVPAVDLAGQVVLSPAVAAAESDASALVADQVVPGGRVESAVFSTSTFQTFGVTWPQGTRIDGLAGQIRTRSAGAWSDWVPLEASDGSPDAGSPDALPNVRGGTDSVWVGDSDAVQVSFAASGQGGPSGLSLVLIGSPATPPPAAGAVTSSTTSGASFVNADFRTGTVQTAIAAPQIISRAQWGARAPVCTPDVASTLVGAVIHHTAGSNSYSTVAEAEQQIRNDQNYHIDGRGWCDIGYNFIVDKWGNIYEGRANSETQAVIGVHAGGFNTGTLGVAMLGDYSTIVPSAATQEAVAEVVAWRLSAYGRNPAGTMSYWTGGGETSRYPAGTTVTLPVVMGHRDVDLTACPGAGGYSILGWVRTRAASIAYSQPLVRALYHDMLQRDVDPSGLQTWTAVLLRGTPASALANTLAHSQEYVQRRIVEAYAQILGRAPDPSGLATWTNEIMSGRLRVEDLRGTLIASDEYFARAGGTTASYIAHLYHDILNREAGPSEIAWWSATTATAGRGSAANGVWRSLESAQLRVNEIYQIFLDRSVDPTGLGTWAPYWQAYGEDSLRAQIAGSDEYVARSIRLF